MSDHWITNIAFTTNLPVEPGKCEFHTFYFWALKILILEPLASGILAYGTSTGAVGLLDVAQALVEKTGPSLFCPEYVIEIKVQDRGLIFESDKAGITSMRWISLPDGAVGTI